MRSLFRIALLLVNADRRAMARGAALSVVVLVMGAALLGLSGWFVTATGLAGIAGIGIAFDVFRPSAGVRFLALGRTAARYGERLLTHDATLRALAALRVVLLRGHARETAAGFARLRSEAELTRILSDVDALDGVILRLILPVVSAVVTHLVVFAALAWLVGWPVAWVILAGYLPLAALVFMRLARRGVAPSKSVEETGQRLRRGVIDMMRDRTALILAAQLPDRERAMRELEAHGRDEARVLDRVERDAGAMITVLVALVAMGAFVTGAWMLDAGDIGPAKAVIGVFVALALAEALMPLRRGVSEIGRMTGAAERVVPRTVEPSVRHPDPRESSAVLLEIDRPNLSIRLEPGEAVALTGPSGVGKSSLLMDIAGLGNDSGIRIAGAAPGAWPEDRLRGMIAALPQRSALVAGTIRENLELGRAADDAVLWRALDAVMLSDDVRARGGLDARLGESGAGLSGGQSRRLSLARVILREPRILLLDEPTEGLDAATADAVLRGVRDSLPRTAVLAAMHRGSDHDLFDRRIKMTAAL
ncbi:amino acid ABC transporter ATP-binding/permease protein [Amaricoccus tamworthensis]|uniref:amino acid ABC transporter ATP-binding/permease protein n=1 Tax=Amaricoccus tamworthensis TaxID=57002 RepID=UPI003C7BFD01